MSLDKSIESFLRYFSLMPWIALPPSDPGTKVLSSKLCVYSIPTLVVLDKNGMFISNNAKAEVDTAMRNGDADDLIQTWKNFDSVPIEEANIGIMSNVWSSFKKSLGCGTESNGMKERVGKDKVPGTLLLSFFEDASKRLAKHPNQNIKGDLLREVETSGVKIPISLKNQRQLVLQEQISALKDSAFKYNSSSDEERNINEEQIQRCLRHLGQEDFSYIATTDKVAKKDLLVAMAVMNETARIAFTRSVIWTEIEFNREMRQTQQGKRNNLPECSENNIEKYIVERNLHGTVGDVDKKESGMSRLDAIDFAGLCSVGFRLPEVKNYVQGGHSDFFNTDELNVISSLDLPLHRILQFQRMILCALGYAPQFGGKQLKMLMVQDDISEDSQLYGALSEYVSSVHNIVTLSAPKILSSQEDGDIVFNNTFDLAQEATTFKYLISFDKKEPTQEIGQVEEFCKSPK